MGINDLHLKPSHDIRIAQPTRSVASRLKVAARYGEFKNLSPQDQKTIIQELEKRKTSLRFRGGLSLSERRSALYNISKGKGVTRTDMRDARRIVTELARGAAAKKEKPVKEETSVKASDGKSYLTEEQVARNLRRSQRDRIYAESGSIGRGEFAKQYAGGRIVKSFGVRGTAKDIGIDRERAGKIGFAGNYQNNKLPDSGAPKMPPGGIKPIGLMNN